MKQCVFCNEAASPATALTFLDASWPFADRLIWSGTFGFGIPGYGPQVYPYVLFVTRRHHMSLATTSPAERREFIEFLNDVARKLMPSGEVEVFEHGGCGSDETNGCLDHCHVHVIDGRYALLDEFVGAEIGNDVYLSEDTTIKERGPYLFCGRLGVEGGICGYVSSPGTRERQYFRRMLAHKIGSERWNWRENMNPHFMERVVRTARSSTDRTRRT
jgi:diadenosine tetraphosphate (Ap4A) HIT family hydrolase